MPRPSFEETELPRRRAIAATALLDPNLGDYLDYLPDIYLFLGKLRIDQRLSLAQYLRLSVTGDQHRDRARLFVAVKSYLELSVVACALRKRRGIVTRLCLWGWNPYRSSAPTDNQRERTREADDRLVELAKNRAETALAR
jgi:hypothetical protein